MRQAMKRSVLALCLCFIGSSVAAEPNGKFDLVCSSILGEPLHFRFDLVQKKWCASRCPSVRQIDDLTDALIHLSMRSAGGWPDWDITINRYTATYAAVHDGYGNAPLITANARQSHSQASQISSFDDTV